MTTLGNGQILENGLKLAMGLPEEPVLKKLKPDGNQYVADRKHHEVPLLICVC